jgi:hypothetical protein
MGTRVQEDVVEGEKLSFQSQFHGSEGGRRHDEEDAGEVVLPEQCTNGGSDSRACVGERERLLGVGK